MTKYSHKEIEKKWQKKWQEEKIFYIDKDKETKRGNYYVLDMFPYPSGSGFHMGHMKIYTGSDILARYKNMSGFNVLHPQGFDSFGLPAENYAIKTGTHPKIETEKNMENFFRQWKEIGSSYDLENLTASHTPEYYKWTQFLFGKFFENDFVFRKEDTINWCPSCNTGIANEQVESGKCERCKTDVEQKEIPGWFFKITDFAEELIWDEKNSHINWPEHTKKNQNAWIGKSEGAEIDFKIREPEFLDINRDGRADSYQDGVEEIERFNIVAIIESPNGEDFLCAKWKKSDWQGFVTGGIEDGDMESETALKEVSEETGYQNAEVVKIYDKSSHGKFFHVGKKINRFAHYKIVHVKLKDLEKKERSQEEKEIADMVWVKKDEVENFLKRQDMKYVWRVFENKDFLEEEVKVFTTRPDTIFGATYVVLAPENPLVKNFLKKGVVKNNVEVEKYVEETKKKTELDRLEGKEKTGVRLEGVFATNPACEKSGVENCDIPVFISDYVLARYGTGAIMAVPAHDERDNEFAKRFGVEIKEVFEVDNGGEIFTGTGVLINSWEFNGMESEEAKEKITEFVEGKIKTTYRLRDWSVSRQRYWGCPIPIVYSPEGVAKFVGQENLPWVLPEDVDFVPMGVSPLSKSKELKERVENIFGKGWTPEFDTLDTFVDSSWYFLRYPDTNNSEEFCSKERLEKWMSNGLDLYIGGEEHTYMHLLYARYFTKAMKKMGMLGFDEPFKKLVHQGFVCDKEGKKMSKSKGNIVNPDEMTEKFGADSVRTYMMFSAPFEDDVNWNEDNIVGVYRFLEKVWALKDKISEGENIDTKRELVKTIKKVGEQIESLKYNTAVSDMMKFVNFASKEEKINKEDFGDFLKILSPFAPHICDELTGEILLQKDWPEFNESFLQDEKIVLGVQVNGKRRGEIEVSPEEGQLEAEKKARENPEIEKWLEGETKKVVYVKGRILNFIV